MMLEIRVNGLDKTKSALEKLGKNLMAYVNQGLVEAGKEIVKSKGIGIYPPETDANRPPTPYYIRGRGTQYKSHNANNSQKYGTQYHVDRVNEGAKIYNNVSYAQYVGGDKQPDYMARIGWRKLVDVAEEQRDKIKKTVLEWIRKAKADAGL